MYRAILLILYLIVLIPGVTCLIRYRQIPFSRRLSVGLSVPAILFAPTFAGFLCDLLSSLLSISSSLNPEWVRDSAQSNLPCGSGTILFASPHNAYLEICQYVEEWSKNYFLIIHLGNGLQAGTELLNIFSTIEQCLVFCDSIPQSIRNTDTRSITQLEFLQQMHYLLVFSSGAETESLVNLLPTYQYEKISNTTNLNTYRGRSILHPFRGHHGHGISVGQTRTMEYKKNIFEADELQRIFSDGYALVYNTILNSVFLVRII